MNANRRRAVRALLLAAVCMVAVGIPKSACATIPYNNPGPYVAPMSMPALPLPTAVKGKEYSHNLDEAVGGVLDPARVIAWDGLGGTGNGADLSTPAPPYSTSGQFQIDGLANQRDALFVEVQQDNAHLIYSVDSVARTTLPFGLLPFTVPSGGPISVPDTIKAGFNAIGGAGEYSYELGVFGGALAPNSHGLWAAQTAINGMPLPVDVDDLEIWGPEPESVPLGGNASVFSDADKYSVDTDLSTAAGGIPYSVWNYSPVDGHSGYVPQFMVVDLVRSLLNAPNLNAENVDLDALMVMDFSDPALFEPGDKILFSIRQVSATFAADGFFATGSEVFVLDGGSTAAVPLGGFLFHGGHAWDKAYALANMVVRFPLPRGLFVDVQLDLDGLEAVSSPEPGTLTLILIAVAGMIGCRRRRRSMD